MSSVNAPTSMSGHEKKIIRDDDDIDNIDDDIDDIDD